MKNKDTLWTKLFFTLPMMIYRISERDLDKSTRDQAIHHTAKDDLPYLRKSLRQEYTQCLIDFYELQKDPIQQQDLQSARTFRNQHGV